MFKELRTNLPTFWSELLYLTITVPYWTCSEKCSVVIDVDVVK